MESIVKESNAVSLLGDDELVAELHLLAGKERALTARMLVHLGEVDARRLYRDRAWSSMFVYAVEELHMTEQEAYLRIQAARLGRRFPLIVALLGRGALHLSAIKLLAPHLTQDNHATLLEGARGKSKRAVELLVAELAPKLDVPSRMRRLPERRAARAAPAQLTAAGHVEHPAQMAAEQAQLITQAGMNHARIAAALPVTRAQNAAALSTPARQPSASDGARDNREPAFELTAPPPRRSSSTPLSPGRYKVELTAGQALHDKLEQLKNLMRHQVPDGDLAVVLERAADVLIEKIMKDRFGQTRAKKQPRTRRPRVRQRWPRLGTSEVHSRYIPRAVVREVYERDGGQCAFMGPDGRRCTERGFLELHHEIPYARGGPATVDNIKLVCKAHNALLAERDYGKSFMQAKLSDVRRERQHSSHTSVSQPDST